MKHRLEFWKYTIFEYEEATEHLNEMAARGWALREITLAWMPVACYEKDDGADGYTYTVEVMTELEDEDLLVLCQDAGWERILQCATAGSTIGVIWCVMSPLVFMAGAWIRLIWQKNVLGWGVMCLGVMAFFMDLSVLWQI